MISFPKPTKTLLQLLGPSVIFVALSLNGGEMLLWPDLVGRYGLRILWPVPIILLFQYFVNLEIERYTVATGKNTLNGLITLNKWIAPLFTAGILISLMWPAWASTAGNMLAFTVGLPEYGAWFAVGLLAFMLLIWNSKKSYNVLEFLAKLGMITVLGITIYIIARLFGPDLLSSKLATTSVIPAPSDYLLFISALAFGGVVGVLNLVQSDWVAGKGYGLAGDKSSKAVDWSKPESKKNWNLWWRLIKKEHTILFYFGNLIGIFLIALLAAATLTGANIKGFPLLTYQVGALNNLVSFTGLFYGIGIVLLFTMAQMTILDASGHLLKHSLKSKLSSDRISQIIGLIGIGILLITVIYPNFNQPSTLLQISAVLSAAIMALYPPLLLKLNSQLPEGVRPTTSRWFVWACALFYGVVVIGGVVGFLWR